jgi:hypothetical protein
VATPRASSSRLTRTRANRARKDAAPSPDADEQDEHDGERVSSIRPLRRKKPSGAEQSPFAAMLCVVAFTLLVCFYLYAAVQGKGTEIGLILVPIFCLIMAPWLARLDKAQPAFKLLPIAFLGLILRSLATYFRLENAADAIYYHRWGVQLAPSFRALNFDVDTQREIPGTGTVRYISGLVSVFTDTNIFAEFLVFTLAAFIGCVFFYKAFVLALPNGDHRRYALLIFLWPTMVYWPSSIGKEALMTLGVGIASYGAARIFRHLRGGIVPLVAGLWFTFMVRPHIALVIVIAVGVAYIFTSRSGTSASVTVGKMVAIIVLIVGGGILVGRTADFLEVESLGSTGIEQALDQTTYQTSQGDAEFTPMKAENPALLPGAIVTVLLRPFPNEAHNAESFFTSIEGFFLVLLFLASIPRLKHLPRALLRDSYVGYSLAAVVLFCFLFSYVANFGILARQRTQVLPFLFVLLAFAMKPKKKAEKHRQPRRHLRRPEFPRSGPPPVSSPT